jgi:CRP-like cAMP-binding protein
VPAQRFVDLLSIEPVLALFVNQILSATVINQAARTSEIACLPARQRLEQLLWKLAEQEGGGATTDFRLQLPVKQWEAAQLLAITPTYLCRLLAELETDKIVSRRNGWIILHAPETLWHRTYS